MMEIKKKLEEISPASQDRRQPILQDEVHRVIQKLKNNKSSGSDAVPGEAIKAGGEYLEQELYQIIKRSLGKWRRHRKNGLNLLLPP
jgi:hypothetical protein